ncbi:hypothetical protein BDV26DRAFT_272195 [Aspergillus bertholletiae]|uniref:Uncharacterized protein n=1 Tax=Aspergillus bertholletiae TaxID=1226010 RepID=A0A5N7AUG1_9EURO|nr:hypothetical protein BDV26DRAFT_272195 [Aspergillus bertholletiae]
MMILGGVRNDNSCIWLEFARIVCTMASGCVIIPSVLDIYILPPPPPFSSSTFTSRQPEV